MDQILPPPPPSKAVSNVLIFPLASVPAIVQYVDAALFDPSTFPTLALAVFSLVLSVVLAYMDHQRLRADGHDTTEMGSFANVPVYLYKRAVVLKQNAPYLYTSVWGVTYFILLYSWTS